MTRRLQTLNRVLVSLETYAVGGLVITVCVVVLLQVLMRYLFAYPNPWSEEVSRFCFIWMSLPRGLAGRGTSGPLRVRSGHQGIGPAREEGRGDVRRGGRADVRAPPRRHGHRADDLTMGERSSALNLPIALVYAAAPVSGALMVLHMLVGWKDTN